jgi:hypothetical protein
LDSFRLISKNETLEAASSKLVSGVISILLNQRRPESSASKYWQFTDVGVFCFQERTVPAEKTIPFRHRVIVHQDSQEVTEALKGRFSKMSVQQGILISIFIIFRIQK